MFRLLIPILCLLLSMPAAFSAEKTLLSSDRLCADMVSRAADTGAVRLEIALGNRTQEEQEVCLLDPLFNGQPAGFDAEQSQRKTIRLLPGEGRIVSLAVVSDDPAETPEEVSFRFILPDGISTPAAVRAADSACTAAACVPEAERLVAAEVRMPEAGTLPSPILLTDSRAAPPLTEKAQVQICLLEGDGLRILATVPAEVHADGHAAAVYSGLALVLDGNSPFPLTASESAAGWTTDRIAMFSNAIYFAALSVQVAPAADGAAVTGQQLTAAEFGTSASAPWDMFTGGTASCLIYSIREEDGARFPDRVDADFINLTPEGPIRLALVPADALGKAVFYFEYDLSNGDYIIHPVMPVSGGQDGLVGPSYRGRGGRCLRLHLDGESGGALSVGTDAGVGGFFRIMHKNSHNPCLHR